MSASSIPVATDAEVTRNEMECSVQMILEVLRDVSGRINMILPGASELTEGIAQAITLIARTTQTRHSFRQGPIMHKTATIHMRIGEIVNSLAESVREDELVEARKLAAEIQQLGRTLNLLLQVAAN